jgi:hypothetical protein
VSTSSRCRVASNRVACGSLRAWSPRPVGRHAFMVERYLGRPFYTITFATK